MRLKDRTAACVITLLLLIAQAKFHLYAASCESQAQMSPAQREALSNVARDLINLIKSGGDQSLRAKTLPSIASDFGGIATAADRLKPHLQNATITVEGLYSLDETGSPASADRIQFFCGSPTVVLTFNGIPPGVYAVVLLHATGVPKPQQIAVILAKSGERNWLLAGFYSKNLVEAGHDGLWYWASARSYAQKKMNWNAWLYYRVAADLVNPVDFLSSPNFEKLQQETEEVRPPELARGSNLSMGASGATFKVTGVSTTTQFGALDLDVHYSPDPAQVLELRSPVSARKQVTAAMAALIALHPEVSQAFHGIWVHADQGDRTLFALELPMSEIPAVHSAQAANSTPSEPQK